MSKYTGFIQPPLQVLSDVNIDLRSSIKNLIKVGDDKIVISINPKGKPKTLLMAAFDNKEDMEKWITEHADFITENIKDTTVH